MPEHRIAIVGAGGQARKRGKALIETGRAEICGVASRHLVTAKACAEELGCPNAFDDYRQLEQLKPEALLIEVPHAPTHGIALWGIETGCHLYIGGPLGVSEEEGRQIVELAAQKRLLVEGGYSSRYDVFCQRVRHLVRNGDLGTPLSGQSLGLMNLAPHRWYASESISGGMPLTHMTYVFLDNFRWILGEVKLVLAAANRKVLTAPDAVREETCAATLVFADETIVSMVAGYASPGEVPHNWTWRIVCTDGIADSDGSVVLRGGDPVEMDFDPGLPTNQSEAFLDALEGKDTLLCPGEDAVRTMIVGKAISEAAQTGRPVELDG